MRFKKCCISLILLLFGVGISFSQEKRTEICVDFRVNSAVIDSSYSNNAVSLQEIVEFLKKESPVVQQPVITEPDPITQEYEPKEPIGPEFAAEEPREKSPFYMGFKTNLLYNILAIPNIGVEFYLGSNFSVAANWHYAWWKNDKKHNYWRTYGGDLALRYWWGKRAHEKPLTGHHIGLYGQMITYDFELGGRGVLADRWSWAAGLEYGCSLPVAKRLNLDFTIGMGYHWGEFKEYLPIDGHYVWQATKNRNYWGPTKAEISLVWLIGKDNYNVKKGGNK